MFLDDRSGADRAASTVIAVILMVAIAVILGTVVSGAVLSIGERVSDTAPNANFEFETLDNGDVQITHASGGTLEGDQLRFAGAALEKTSFGSINEWSGKTVKASDSATVNVKGGETLRLIWQSTKSDTTTTIAEYDVPDGVGPTASIGSIDTDSVWPPTYRDGEVTVKNIQFNRALNDRVWVVVKDDPAVGTPTATGRTSKQYFSNNGGDLTAQLNGNYISDDETITVIIYETDDESTVLATDTAKA